LGQPPCRLAPRGGRRVLRDDGFLLRWRVSAPLHPLDDLGPFLVELHGILLERLLLALRCAEERKQMSANESSSDKTSDRPTSHHCGSSRVSASGLQSARPPTLFTPATGLLLTSSRFWHL